MTAVSPDQVIARTPTVQLIPTASAPPVPNGLKVICLKDPNTLEPSDTCPVILWGSYSYWPLSYIDNRVSMCLVAYDSAKNVVGQWEMPGARYVVRASVNSSDQSVTFVGQSSAEVPITWATMQIPPVVRLIPVSSAPPVPNGLKVICLKDPNSTEPSDTCPVILWGSYTYWPLSYIDNRLSMCLVAYDAANKVVGQWEMPGARYVVSARVNDSNRTVTFRGQSSKEVDIPWNTMRVPPAVRSVPAGSAPQAPPGLKFVSLKDPNSLEPSETYPVVAWGDYTYWPLSYIDNRVSLCLVAYDAARNAVGQWEMTGARYVFSASVEAESQKLTFVGQAKQTTSIPQTTITLSGPVPQ